MSELKIGQLVACRQAACAEWLLGIFDGEKDGRLYVRSPLSLSSASKKPEWFSQVEPAEYIWPGIFLACDKDIANLETRRSEKLWKIVKELDRMMRWVCQQLAERMPPGADCSGCFGWAPDSPHRKDGSCARCWRAAAKRAVEEGSDE